ncbi:hypothetical protein LM599_04340 [Candidatus Acetothermia bacterium]|nr:hypothetical protein [Candidatus Acetothermia bacterium]
MWSSGVRGQRHPGCGSSNRRGAGRTACVRMARWACGHAENRSVTRCPLSVVRDVTDHGRRITDHG